MNSRRASNRAASSRRAGGEKDAPLRFSAPERHEDMRGRHIAHRHPEHHEEGGNYKHEPHYSHGSPASLGSSKGPGPLPGAGELMSPGSGPGPAARAYGTKAAAEVPDSPAASSAAPRGMKTYNQE